MSSSTVDKTNADKADKANDRIIWALHLPRDFDKISLVKNALSCNNMLLTSRKIVKNPGSDHSAVIPLVINTDVDADHLRNKLELCIGGYVNLKSCLLKVVPTHEFRLSATDSPHKVLRNLVKALLQEAAFDDGSIDQLLSEVPKRWERHGDLVLLGQGAFSDPRWNSLGPKLWHACCSALKCQRIAVNGRIAPDGHRTPLVRLVLGGDGWVTHLDNGIKYSFDVTKCMFSSGNITEKLRVAKLDCHGETVVDLYAGIGYFTLPYLVHAKARHVHSCEWNKDAAEALTKNLQLNGVEDRCTIHFGDCRKVCPEGVADRVNLGLIPSSESGWPTACKALRSGYGQYWLHVHENVDTHPNHARGSEAQTGSKCSKEKQWQMRAAEVCDTIRNMLDELRGEGWVVECTHVEHVKSYAPHVAHIVMDLCCRRQKTP
ncbi:tRNA wybutosine-synthesizing protein 2 homolog [Ixodes scapularis]